MDIPNPKKSKNGFRSGRDSDDDILNEGAEQMYVMVFSDRGADGIPIRRSGILGQMKWLRVAIDEAQNIRNK